MTQAVLDQRRSCLQQILASRLAALLLVLGAAFGWGIDAQAQSAQVARAQNLADLSLEELRDVRVTSVSRRDQSLLEAAASVYVITGEEIRRLGVTTLPEALRLAPNLEVAALDTHQYAITARGFNSVIANKLLVMVDGRTIYSPLFSGTFWDAQDFVPSDIDRIEVISGPAGATWGTNAVNGVINIVTLASGQSQGASGTFSAGNEEKTAWARYGGKLGEDMTFRASIKTFERGPTLLRSGGDDNDAARGSSAAFRADWSHASGSVLIDAGAYTSHTDDRPTYGAIELSGAHVLGKWTRKLDESTDFDLQAYFDRTNRADKFLLQNNASIFDVEGKLRYAAGAHRWLFGAGYRRSQDHAEPGQFFAFFPADRDQSYYNVFAQDEVTLGKDLTLTVGNRFERNPYSGWEVLPSVRLGYALHEEAYVWSALSRAVRAPARLDREIFYPTKAPFILAGGPTFTSEVANVFELGYRAQAGPSASWSATAFVQDYDHLRSAQIVDAVTTISNKIAGQILGVEAWGNVQPVRNWRLDAGLLYLDKRLHLTAGSNDPGGPSALGNDPHLQWSLRSTHSISQNFDFLLAVRHVNRLPSPPIPSYTAGDAQFNWRPIRDVQLSVGVRNAFDKRHPEFDSGPLTSEIPRSAFVAVTFQPR